MVHLIWLSCFNIYVQVQLPKTCFIGKQQLWVLLTAHMRVECFLSLFIFLRTIHLNHLRYFEMFLFFYPFNWPDDLFYTYYGSPIFHCFLFLFTSSIFFYHYGLTLLLSYYLFLCPRIFFPFLLYLLLLLLFGIFWVYIICNISEEYAPVCNSSARATCKLCSLSLFGREIEKSSPWYVDKRS